MSYPHRPARKHALAGGAPRADDLPGFTSGLESII